jgi:hypothetical protein
LPQRGGFEVIDGVLRSSVFGGGDDNAPLEIDGRVSPEGQRRALFMHRLMMDKYYEHDDTNAGQVFTYYLFERELHLIFYLNDISTYIDNWAVYARNEYREYENITNINHELHGRLRNYLNEEYERHLNAPIEKGKQYLLWP